MFKTREELLASIGIEEAGLSTEACDILKKKQISTLSQILKLDRKDFDSEVTDDIIEEIVQAAFEIDLKPTYALDKDFILPEEYTALASEVIKEFTLPKNMINKYLSIAYYENYDKGIDAVIKSLYSHETPRKVLRNRIINAIQELNNKCDLSNLRELLPPHLTNASVVYDIIRELCYEHKLLITGVELIK